MEKEAAPGMSSGSRRASTAESFRRPDRRVSCHAAGAFFCLGFRGCVDFGPSDAGARAPDDGALDLSARMLSPLGRAMLATKSAATAWAISTFVS
jgi:hypothetical protein